MSPIAPSTVAAYARANSVPSTIALKSGSIAFEPPNRAIMVVRYLLGLRGGNLAGSRAVIG